MKKIFFCLLVTGCSYLLSKGQQVFKGQITDSISKSILSGVVIIHKGTHAYTLSDKNGNFEFNNLNQEAVLEISLLGYEKKKFQITNNNIQLYNHISLSRKFYLAEEVLVRSTRATAKDGTVYTEITQKELEKDNLGEDLPFLVENTPSLVATSEAGAGIGYTGVRIRGSDATRINVTINGIPYNDSESLGTYFVDIPDIASSLSSIQIQRGLGTSTNGAGAFGGSLNLETSNFKSKTYFTTVNSYGSFNTLKNSLEFGTGLLYGKWNFNLRLSRISSDGYIERASSNLKSFFFSAGYFGKNEFLKANIFSGSEKTYQVFQGVPEDSLPSHRRFNPFNYQNQTDNYIQDHYQLFYSKKLDSNLQMNLALHLTHGKGYYEEYKISQAFSDYSLPNLTIGNSTIDTTNLIRRQWLDNYFYGTTFSLIYLSPKHKYTLNWGGAYNQYKGQHFGEVIWAEYASNIPINYRYYNFNGFKTDLNSYIKYNQEIGNLTLNTDLQFRRVFYRFLGYDENKNNTTQIAILNFFNPKFGLNYSLNLKESLYVSYGIGHKEANQTDYSQSTPISRPSPERLNDLELGYRNTNSWLGFGLNFYWMNYKNQLVLTGQINDVGAYINTNVAKSSRTGIETDWNFKFNQKLRFLGNISLSNNKIRIFNEYLTNESGVQTLIIHKNSDIGFSPNWIGSASLDFEPVKALHILLISKYVSQQYLDNTSNSTRKIDRYFVENIKVHYSLKNNLFHEINFSLALNNIFSNLYVSDGYTSPGIIQGKIQNNNFYYPQAPFNVLGGISLKF